MPDRPNIAWYGLRYTVENFVIWLPLKTHTGSKYFLLCQQAAQARRYCDRNQQLRGFRLLRYCSLYNVVHLYIDVCGSSYCATSKPDVH